MIQHDTWFQLTIRFMYSSAVNFTSMPPKQYREYHAVIEGRVDEPTIFHSRPGISSQHIVLRQRLVDFLVGRCASTGDWMSRRAWGFRHNRRGAGVYEKERSDKI